MPVQKALLAVLTALLLTILVMAALLALPPDIWAGWAPATCMAGHCFCETLNPASPIRQPANTLSSLIYLLPGCAILLLEREPLRPARRFPRAFAMIVGASALVTGLGSAFYHASLSLAGQFLDNLGMQLLAGMMLVYAIQRSLDWSDRQTMTVYTAACVLFTGLQVALPDTRRYLFAVVLVLALLLEYRLILTHQVRTTVRFMTTGVALFTLAFGIWITDQTGLLCNPNSLLQGHALWHLLGALGVWLLYRYYTSEQL